MQPQDRIVLDSTVSHGKPVIRGTRVPVTIVIGSLAGGMTFEEIQREYDITADDIRAALRFVGELAEQESFHPLPGTSQMFVATRQRSIQGSSYCACRTE
jgi:uncharacterized protein (DUF433 family)